MQWQARRLSSLCLVALCGAAFAGPRTPTAPADGPVQRHCEHEQARYSPGAIVQVGSRVLRCVEARVLDSKAPPRLVWVELLGPDGEAVSVQMTR